MERATGAVVAPTGGGRFPWLAALLGLLALAAVVALIAFLTHRGTSTGTAVATTAPSTTASAVTSPAASVSPATPSAAVPAATGQLTTNGQSLYPVAATGTVTPQSGQTATSSSIGVVELAGAPATAGSTALDDERFFVGDAAHETLVFLHINAEPPFEIAAGQHYTFSGIVRPYTDGAVSGLTADAKAKAQKAGYYIEVTSLSQFHAG